MDTLYTLLIQPFEYGNMTRAAIGLLALSLSAGPLGLFLMLRRMSLAGDAMSHAILPGVAIAYFYVGTSVGLLTLGGFFAGVGIIFLAGLIARSSVIKEDASLTAFYLISLALGVVMLTAHGKDDELVHILFGSVMELGNDALILLGAIATATLLALAIIIRPLVLDTFDPLFLKRFGKSGALAHFLFLGLIILNLVGGFHALGTLLAIGLMMLPAMQARLWSNDLSMMILLSIVFGVITGLVGLLVAFHSGAEAGPSIVLTSGIFYVISLFFAGHGGYVWRLLPRKHTRA